VRTIREGRRGGRTRRAIGAGLSLLALGLVLTACGSSGPTSSPTTKPDSTTTSIPTPQITTPTTTIDGHTYPVPTEPSAPGKPIDTYVATGDQVILTSKGFVPYRLFADLNTTITWTNLTGHTVTIRFLREGGARSGPIPPGGTFTYSSKTLDNFEYQSSTGFHGIVNIGAFQT
jgi:hypothetical protein